MIILIIEHQSSIRLALILRAIHPRSAAAATLLALRVISPIRGIYPASWGKQVYIIR